MRDWPPAGVVTWATETSSQPSSPNVFKISAALLLRRERRPRCRSALRSARRGGTGTPSPPAPRSRSGSPGRSGTHDAEGIAPPRRSLGAASMRAPRRRWTWPRPGSTAASRRSARAVGPPRRSRLLLPNDLDQAVQDEGGCPPDRVVLHVVGEPPVDVIAPGKLHFAFGVDQPDQRVLEDLGDLVRVRRE